MTLAYLSTWDGVVIIFGLLIVEMIVVAWRR